MSPATLAYTINLKSRIANGFATKECDYSKILALELPVYIGINANWCIVPEWVLSDNVNPDYLISKIDIDDTLPTYGMSYNHLVAEAKNRLAVSWWTLINTQAWNQCDLAKGQTGSIYFIGLIGFEICFFHFDVRRYPSASGNYRIFFPLNIRNFSTSDLDELDIKYLTEVTNGNNEIRVIKWKLDDKSLHIYIDEMFNHILNNSV